MTDRDELAGWLRSVYLANRDMFTPAGAGMEGWQLIADQVAAMGWAPPSPEHANTEHR